MIMNFFKKKLQVVPFDDISEDEYHNLYQLSISVRDYITEQVKDEKTGDIPENFWWLRVCATRPAFHHLCFSYKATVYSCFIGRIVDNQIYVFAQDWENFLRETKRFGLQACLIPLKIDDNEKSVEVQPYLDANTLKPIVFKEEGLNDPLPEWELYCIGVNQVVEYLADNQATDIEYCDIPDLKPSIFFTDGEGNKSYVIVRSIPIGLEGVLYVIDEKLINKYKEQGLKGYFANVKWSNIFGNSGMFQDEQVYHHSLVNSKIELEPIEDAPKNHSSVLIDDEDIYKGVI